MRHVERCPGAEVISAEVVEVAVISAEVVVGGVEVAAISAEVVVGGVEVAEVVVGGVEVAVISAEVVVGGVEVPRVEVIRAGLRGQGPLLGLAQPAQAPGMTLDQAPRAMPLMLAPKPLGGR
ncbi:hypothetical protein AB0J80_03150 [Actinoplanes sp. NPDC049548]|uniref:hypothetical protein n=1 Tax=Actinoplanes sp. NPDC049548 TaxID=3155152 RepID=UPI00342D50E1